MDYKKKNIEHGITCVTPLPNLDELRQYYETKYYQDANGTSTYDASYTNEELAHKILESDLALFALDQKMNKDEKKISLLEFGCGEGFFLKQAITKTNWNVHGIDFSQFGIQKWHPEIIDSCSFGDSYDFLNNYIDENKKFNICAIRNVLEHVIDPKKLLLDLKKVLHKKGLLLITVPNDYSNVQMSALDNGFIENDFWFSPPDHLYYFNASNIIDFAENIGYKVIDIFSSFPVDFFLFHPGSNYIKDKKNGKSAHFARIKLDLLMAQSGIENLLNLYRSMAKCGVGRDITVILSVDN